MEKLLYLCNMVMDLQGFFTSLLNVVCEMAPYLLLGFFIAGVLHVFVPQKFYANYLSRNNKLSVVWAALLGVPLPLCSCGVIPTAIGLRNEKASKGAIASFLIATPQTGIDSILATFSLMGLGFAIIRPTAALVTGVCGGLLVNRLVREDDVKEDACASCQVESGNRILRVLKYAYYDMLRDIGLRLLIGLVVAALIQVAVPDEFFLSFGSQPLLQMLVILVIAVPMYICSTGSIPVAAALMMKGLSPGAALVMLMAGPARGSQVDGASLYIDLSDDHCWLCCPFRPAAQCYGDRLPRRCPGCLLHEHIRPSQSIQDYLRHSINIINYICSYDETIQQIYRQKALRP